MTLRIVIALLFLGVDYYAYAHFATRPVIPPRAGFDAFPNRLGHWVCREREEITPDVIANLGVTDYLLCSYEREQPYGVIGVYVGYHETQIREEGGGAGENSIHPPEHCLPGSGWDIIDLRVVPAPGLGLPGRSPEVKRALIARGEARQLTYFWYQSRGRVISRNHEVILYRMWDRATRGRTDGSLVRFTVPVVRGDVESAEAAFRDLAQQLVPALESYVPL